MLNPPRERPRAWSPPPFSRQRRAGGRARSCRRANAGPSPGRRAHRRRLVARPAPVPRRRPAASAGSGVHRPPRAESRRQVAPGHPGREPPDDALHDQPVIDARATTSLGRRGEQWLQACPLRIRQRMSFHVVEDNPCCRHALDQRSAEGRGDHVRCAGQALRGCRGISPPWACR